MSPSRIALASMLLACLLAGPGLAAGPTAAVPDQDLITLGKRVEDRVSKLRGLAAVKPIRWEVTDKERVRAYVKKTLAAQYGPGELAKEGLALAALGLIPRELDYPGFIIGLLEEQIGGYYDPIEEIFYLADWIAPAAQESIIAHELCHALQDQHFDIDRFIERQAGDADGMLARASLAEGEATLVMMLDATRSAGVEIDPGMLDLDGPLGGLMMGMSAVQFPEFAKAPRALREGLMFPYLKGLGFVAYGRREGGWKRIDAVYRKLPQSSEQIIHPEKYFDQPDPPTRVGLDFLDGRVDAGWEQIYEDVLGEFMSGLLLDAVGDRDEERRAAAGWDGDRVRVYRQSDRLAWIGLWVFDSVDDATEFAGAFAKTVPSRHPDFARQPLGTEPVMRFVGPAGTSLLIARDGRWVVVIDGFADETARALRAAAKRE